MVMKKTVFLLIALCGLPNWLPLARAHDAHEHGAAQVNIAVDGAQVNIGFESPLANLLPFEHSPETPEQRRQVQNMAHRLNQAETLFKLTPAAECRLSKVSLESENLDAALLNPEAPSEPAQAEAQSSETAEEHGDLDADFTFLCATPEKLNSLDILLFDAWPNLEKIEAQLATSKGRQRAETLSAEKHLLSW